MSGGVTYNTHYSNRPPYYPVIHNPLHVHLYVFCPTHINYLHDRGTVTVDRMKSLVEKSYLLYNMRDGFNYVYRGDEVEGGWMDQDSEGVVVCGMC